MPKAKKTESEKKANDSEKNKKKSKSTAGKKSKTSTKKSTSKSKSAPQKKTNTKTKTKAKPVIVDVISDEEENQETFFSDESLSEAENELENAKKFFLDLEEEKKDEKELEVKKENKGDKKATVVSEENDMQKQFFAGLVNEMREKKGANKDSKRVATTKRVGLYRSLAWKFLVIVGFLALIVFYFSFPKLTILITPEVEAMNDALYLKISNQSPSETRPGDARYQVEGAVVEKELSVSKTYTASGEEYVGEEIVGKVKIINNYSSPQPLVATTRLLSPDNKLYRIKEAVNVPAGGEVEVEIYADEVSRDMAIGPSRFTIPGLWVGLQDKIYAESFESFKYEQKLQLYVKASDVQLAKSEAYDLILSSATEDLENSEKKILYKILEPVAMTISAEAGDKEEQFTMSATGTVAIVSFTEEEVERLAQAKLSILVPDDKELTKFNADSLNYILESYDEEESVATVKATFSGMMILKNDASVIDKERLVNLKEEQIRMYLREYPEIYDYDLKFYPSFIERAPHLVDRIDIKIKQ